MARAARSERVPTMMKSTFDDIRTLTDPFCLEWLNEEYRQLVREAAAALCRKRPSPLVRGRIDIWACGIVLAVGSVNFLHDRSQDPHLSTADVCGQFGVKQSTGSNKASLIRDTLNMRPMDVDWCLTSSPGPSPTGMDNRSERSGGGCAPNAPGDSGDRFRARVNPVPSRRGVGDAALEAFSLLQAVQVSLHCRHFRRLVEYLCREIR